MINVQLASSPSLESVEEFYTVVRNTVRLLVISFPQAVLLVVILSNLLVDVSVFIALLVHYLHSSYDLFYLSSYLHSSYLVISFVFSFLSEIVFGLMNS